MPHSRPSPVPVSASGKHRERGYILLTLVFFVAVLALSLAAILPSIRQEIQRDRELELVHRGAQYTRAIRLYYKKTGRYPAKIEDLESTNNLRFLRRRYKDPMARVEGAGGNGPDQADFKILHFGDPAVHLQQNQPGISAAAMAAQSQGDAGGTTGGRRRRGGSSPSLALAPNPTDPNQNNPDATAADGSAASPASSTPAKDPNAAAGDADQADGQDAGATGSSSNKSGPGDQSFGGGAMVGVASTSDLDTIREYNKKHRYNQWQFLYDPTTDRGGLPNGPWQPQTFTGQPAGQQPVGTPIGQPVNPVPGGNGSTDHNPQQ